MNLNRKEAAGKDRTLIGCQEYALPNEVWWAREVRLMGFPPLAQIPFSQQVHSQLPTTTNSS